MSNALTLSLPADPGDAKAYNKVRSKVVIHPAYSLPTRSPLHDYPQGWVIGEDSGGPLTCESHPDRVWPIHEAFYAASVHEPAGVYDDNIGPDGFEVDGWGLTVTLSGWTYGDEKCELAVCPECAVAQYRFEIEAEPHAEDCADCGRQCYRTEENDAMCVANGCFLSLRRIPFEAPASCAQPTSEADPKLSDRIADFREFLSECPPNVLEAFDELVADVRSALREG